MPRYSTGRGSADPRWITAKFQSKCSCGATVRRGDRIFYYPSSKAALCEGCGRTAEKDFQAAAFDESVYNYGARA